jgi:glycosyltransferase involved in cell wall biosynthesis
MKAPLVSVIMIFLNAERFMPEAIKSVLYQTYSEWELILVDDGSTDGSSGIALNYVDRYPGKIHFVEHDGHQNRGMSASRNLGLAHSRGDFIAFLDADDVFLSKKLERQVNLLAGQPAAGMIYGNTQYWYSWTGRPEDIPRDRMRSVGVSPNRLYPPPELLRGFLQNSVRTPATCGVLIRRSAVEKAGGFEEQFTGMFEDQAFFYKLCLRTPVFVESGWRARYRQHSDSWSSKKRKTGEWHPNNPLKPAHNQFYRWLEAYLAGQGNVDPTLMRTLQNVTWPNRHPGLYRFLHMIGMLFPG